MNDEDRTEREEEEEQEGEPKPVRNVTDNLRSHYQQSLMKLIMDGGIARAKEENEAVWFPHKMTR